MTFPTIMTAVPNLFGTRGWFCGRQFFHGPGVGRVVSGWFKGIAFIMHLIITSTPPQITRHCIPEAGDPWTMGSEWQEKTVTLDYCEWNLEGGCGLWEERAPGVHCRQVGHTSPEGPSHPLKVPASLSVLLINWSPLSGLQPHCSELGKLTGPPTQPQATQPSLNPSAHWLQGKKLTLCCRQ